MHVSTNFCNWRAYRRSRNILHLFQKSLNCPKTIKVPHYFSKPGYQHFELIEMNKIDPTITTALDKKYHEVSTKLCKVDAQVIVRTKVELKKSDIYILS